jgi:uncharacterized protein YkvS
MASTDVLKLTFCSIEYHESGHYLLVSHEDSFNPIKLHQTAMNKLHRHLVMAFKEVGNLKEFGDIDCGVIDSHDNMDVYLVICNWATPEIKTIKLPSTEYSFPPGIEYLSYALRTCYKNKNDNVNNNLCIFIDGRTIDIV